MRDPLNRLLRDWSKQNAPADDALARMEQAILRAAASPQALPRRPMAAPRAAFWPALSHAALGAAVVLLVGGVYLAVTMPRHSTMASPPLQAGVTPERLARGRILFDSVESLFSDRLRWISESNGDVGLGIDNVTAAINAAAVPVLIRLTVVSRRRGEASWTRVWGTDIMTRPEEVANIVPDRQPANELSLWVYPLEDGKLAVNTSLTLASPVRFSADSENIVAPGVPACISALREGDTEYELYQTVVSLDGHHAHSAVAEGI